MVSEVVNIFRVEVTFERMRRLAVNFTSYITTLQSIMNTKLSQHRIWQCHENRLIKMQTILWVKAYPS